MREVVIDPITRLEGHGKIVIKLDENGNVQKAILQVPELRGFEKFLVGRTAEDAPQITSRICGVCPWAHHMAATKALDDLFKVEPPLAAKMIREFAYNVFMLEDHALHFFVLGGPDFIVGPTAAKEERNLVGIIKKLGADVVKNVIITRKKLRYLEQLIGGKITHPVLGLPGGVAKPLSDEDWKICFDTSKEGIEFAKFAYKALKDIVLSNDQYVELIKSDAYTHKTYYMGLVDDNNNVNFYDGKIRVVDPEGREFAKFDVRNYLDHIAEHVEPWTYVRFTYLKGVGWKGFVDGKESGIYSVAPLARLNASNGMATPMANELYKEFYQVMGGKPIHSTLAFHWARVIEMVYAAERMMELIENPEIRSKDVRNLPKERPDVGIGVVEAPRGTLIHHYETDERGIIKRANLIVATQNNSARMVLSVDKAARSLIKNGKIDDGILNMVEMAFRAYDPCHACATHSLPGSMPLIVRIYDSDDNLIKEIRRD
ncbi:MAG: Ni/Fe hydrogenase subunit alpha [Candidatus Korarchaeota archaeon NZ13-K]|nr:MAG: Ni/Fe hydrogenase subunit alpha [Candidatus Korarchaeota archaeon NZ13-K]